MRKIGLTLLLFLLYGSTWAQTTQTAGQKAVQAKQATVIDTDSLLQQLEKIPLSPLPLCLKILLSIRRKESRHVRSLTNWLLQRILLYQEQIH